MAAGQEEPSLLGAQIDHSLQHTYPKPTLQALHTSQVGRFVLKQLHPLDSPNNRLEADILQVKDNIETGS